MGRIERFRRLLAVKLWPEYDGMERENRLFRTSMNGIAEHNKWLKDRYRKELDGSIQAKSNLNYIRGCLHTLAAEADLMIGDAQRERSRESEADSTPLFPWAKTDA